MDLSRQSGGVLIVGIIPYFLERDNFWFEQNIKKLLEARKTQSFFENNVLFLEKGRNYNLSELLRKLDEMGYEKVFRAEEPGEFSQRGGVLDVFPINNNFAFRFEFLGNRLENISELPEIMIEDEKKAKELLKKKLKSRKIYSDIKGLKIGDYLVHLDHGVAQFSGIEKSEIRNPKSETNPNDQNSKFQTQDYYILGYAANDKLYVPVGLERKLSRYIGFVEPKISRLGSSLWQKAKRKVKEEVEKFAKELLEIAASREIAKRPPYLPDDEIDQRLAASFLYLETADQQRAIEDVKKDLEKDAPMDRIVCGDVGFGKTEVALRAMVKVVKSGFQTAMLCPTTILAHQHFQNFKERLKNLPIKIALFSRLQTKKEQKEIIKNLEAGKIDILIGTHRLLSKDLENWLNKIGSDGTLFYARKRGLGLLVIDDEHKFGVRQKEKLKKLRAELDVLSLSATPIPRTLYMALSSLKDVSLIQTPPFQRMSIKNFVLPFSDKIIKEAINKEIKRGGKVYYLHNRVQTIETARNFLEECLKCHFKHRVEIGIAHGRLKEKKLIQVMKDFRDGDINVLVATTIIESGLDLPDVNTLIVADATRLGLSQAYQIRGRVGRGDKQAFAYFFYPPKFFNKKFWRASPQKFSQKAMERLKYLKESEDLGSGYKIALKDLEIRGAGNILGKEQSGSINQVGLNLYCQILSEAVEKIKIVRLVQKQ